MANTINMLAEEREDRQEEDKAVLEPAKELVEASLWLLAFTFETPSMTGGRHHEAWKRTKHKRGQERSQGLAKASLHFTEMNDESLEKMLQSFKDTKIRKLINTKPPKCI